MTTSHEPYDPREGEPAPVVPFRAREAPPAEPDADTAEAAEDTESGDVPAGPAAVVRPRVRRAWGEPGELRQIIPDHLRTMAGVRQAIRWRYRRVRHITLYHLVRSPQRLVYTLVWAGVGAVRLANTQIAWWWVTEQEYLRHEAIAANDQRGWYQLHHHVREVRLVRGFVLAGEAAGTVLAGAIVTSYLPAAWLVILAVVVPLLAWIGRPADKPIVDSAVVPVAFEQLSAEVIVRALGALGIAEMNKALRLYPDNAVVLIDPITRDGPGWLARLDLPFGVTAGAVSEKREELGSGLRRQLGCVWPETDHKRHPGALNLFVADEDMTTAEQPAWPLAKRGTTDLFKPQVFGFDPRGKQVAVTLMFASVIIGSLPRMGKSFLLRLLLLICALCLPCEMHLFDLKGTGDLAPLRVVAHRYRCGDDPEDLDYMVTDFRALRTEMRRRTKVIRRIAEEDPKRCPDNKVTPELSADKRLGLHPIAIAVDECQVGFEHKTYGTELEEIATDLVKRGPALGMLIMLATQRPDAKSIPTGISANAVLRMCLKVMGQTENDMVLGTSQYKRGIRATMFGFEDKGVFYYSGEGRQPVIVRSQEIDGPAARVIAARARTLREAAGRLTGYALGLDDDADVRSFLDDVLTVFGDDDKLSRETIADRLRGAFPAVYADITPEAVTSQLRTLGVEVKRVRERGELATGCERAAVVARVERADA